MKTGMLLAATAGALALAGAAQADTTVINSTPADTWFFGGGNDYAPANTVVLTTDAGDQLYLRAHQTFVAAPASTGNVYSFALGTNPISYDWGFDSHTGSADGLTASITLTNFAGGSYTYDALFVGNDNEFQDGSTQNSLRLRWDPWGFNPIGFDANVDGSYGVELAVNGLDGGSRTLNIRIDVGDGFQAAVPEPGAWAMMLVGFGGLGAMLRRRRSLALAA